MKNKTLIRITTVPLSLEKLLTGQLRFMNSFYKVVGISSDKERLERLGQTEGIEVFPLEMTRKITPVKDALAVWKLYRYFKKTKPFIVHSHTPKAGIVGMMAAKMAGVPHRLHTVAGLPLLEATGNKRKLLDFVEKLTYSCATQVYPNSFGLLEIIKKQRFCPDSKLKVLANGSSNGIDTAHFDNSLYSEEQKIALRSQLGILPDDFVFVFVGRLVKDKGINELVSAFERLHAQNGHVRLLLVGDFESELDPLFPQTLQAISRNPAIISTGFQPDVRPYFAISDALAFPSYREGFPNVVMQAGAMGLPCIVSDINGCNEIITDEQNGLIIPVKNTDFLYNALSRMVSEVSLQQQMRAASRKNIVENYEQQVVWNALLDAYRKLETHHV